MNERSNGIQRVEIEATIFGHPVIGSLTGRTMSTPDADKPELDEVAIMRTDSEVGLVWVPRDRTAPLSYECNVLCVQDSHMSPTDAVLSTIEWLTSEGVGGVTFTVESPDDKTTYTVEAEKDDDGWSATVLHAVSRDKKNQPVDRPDLVPSTTQE